MEVFSISYQIFIKKNKRETTATVLIWTWPAIEAVLWPEVSSHSLHTPNITEIPQEPQVSRSWNNSWVMQRTYRKLTAVILSSVLFTGWLTVTTKTRADNQAVDHGAIAGSPTSQFLKKLARANCRATSTSQDPKKKRERERNEGKERSWLCAAYVYVRTPKCWMVIGFLVIPSSYQYHVTTVSF